ncbi:MAG: FkbM family methyltransferase [Bacteroidetes bacterium]|nr:FkbM family methyltransferase [Bacteroidota bacterium]
MKIPKLICFDVGARNGLKDLKTLSRVTSLYSFEPGGHENDGLNKNSGKAYANFELINKGLYSSTGIYDLYLMANPSMSSMLKPDEKILDEYFNDITEFKEWRKQLKIVDVKKVETTTIDAVIKEQNIKAIDYLKIDTQGTELEILKGAENSLRDKKINVIKTEFAFIPLYKDQPTFTEIDLYLKGFGYKLITCEFNYDVSSALTKNGEKPKWGIGGDAFYCLDAEKVNDREKILNMAVVIGGLGFLSNATHLFNSINVPVNAQKQFYKNAQSVNKRKMLKYFLPPVFINLYKRLFRK